jgi:heme-degrading monooxygenase HmoA
MDVIAHTPNPPYYAVIFTSIHTPNESEEYATMASEKHALAQQQPGFLGVERAREALGITVSYWRDEDSILAWKRATDRRAAQRLGRERWYAAYSVRVARVERTYDFTADQDTHDAAR